MVIITGASKGIGEFLYNKFGEIVPTVGTYNSTHPVVADADNMYKVDITNEQEVAAWIDDIKDRLQDIVLINCAGVSYNQFAHKADLVKWRRVVEVNLFGTFNVIHSLLPIMREQGYGRIVNFSSVVTQVATPGVSAYAASKAALLGLTRSLAAENAKMGITVNSINLGYVDAGMGVNDVPLSYQEQVKAKLPTGKFCSPQDVYNTIDYIIKTEYLNGTSIDLNGLLY